MIVFKNAHIGYTKSLLEIQDLDLKSGTLYSLLGKNGAGKSTFFKTLLKEVDLLSGQIQIENEELSQINPADLSRIISFVPSQITLIEFMTVRDFLLLGRTPYLNLLGKTTQADEVLLQKCLEKTGVSHLEPRYLSELSDGERQLCAIAKSLMQESKIILLDEPTAYLDYTNKKRILELLLSLSKEEEKLIIFSSHDVEMIYKSKVNLLAIPNKGNTLIEVTRTENFDDFVNSIY